MRGSMRVACLFGIFTLHAAQAASVSVEDAAGIYSNQLFDAMSSAYAAEAALSNSVESTELEAAQTEVAAPALDRLIPQSEEQRIFQRANGGNYIELASGLNYLDEAGVWKSSRVAPKNQSNGSVTFDELPVLHTFAPWSGQRVVVESSRRGGPVAKSALGGLSFYDLSSGKSALIAWVTNSPVQAYDGGVFYERAFLGVDADILYKVHPWGLEQDVVIFGGLPDPADFGMDPAQTHLCALTELIDFNLDEAGVTRTDDVAPAEPAVAAMEVFVDTEDDWTRLYNWQPSFAYPEEGTLTMGGDDGAKEERQSVSMRLFSAMGRVFLSEEIPLPGVAKTMPQVFLRGVWQPFVQVHPIHKDDPIALPPTRTDDGLMADQTIQPDPQASSRRTSRRGDSSPRYVLDYINYTGTSTSNITFASNQTYYISGPLIMSGAKLAIEPGAVVKLVPNAYVGFQNGAWVECRSHAVSPAYFTSAYDTNIGELVLSGASPLSNRYTKGFAISSTSNDLRGLVFKYAGTAMEITAAGHHRIQDVQILNSQRGLSSSGSSTTEVKNVLFRDGSDGAFLSCDNAVLENCTFYKLTNSAVSGITNLASIKVRNSVFYELNNSFSSNCAMSVTLEGNASYNVITGWMGSSVVALGSNTFESGWGGSNHLVAGSSAINAGTTNADLIGLYHYTTATNGLKETNSIVDIGFHYPSRQDSDEDLLYDIQEDLSGNGGFSSNETDISSWTNADTDTDGMPDGWEWLYRLNPQGNDAALDLDGDGYSNLAEYQLGCDPSSLGSRPDLIANYQFNEASWTGGVNEVVDDSGQTNHGRAVNGTLVTNAAFGSVADFDGINDYVTVSNGASLQTVGSMSLSFWIKFDSSAYPQMVMEKYRFGEWAIVANGGGLLWYQGSSGWGGYVVPGSSLLAGKWYFVVATRDAVTRTLKGYVNGVCVYTNTYPSTQTMLSNPSTRALTIGGGSTYSNFDGQLERVMIYGYVPTNSNIVGEYDEDGDGLPKLWEEANSLNPTNSADASLDSDGDGFANNEGYLSGTNPQDTNSTPGYVHADYEFNEASWTGGVNEVVDDSGQLNHGRAINGALVTNTAFGLIADFDGINDYVTVSNSASLQMVGSMSLSFWIKFDSSAYPQMVMEKYRFGEWAIVASGGGLLWYQGLNGWGGYVVPGSSFLAGKWYFVVATRDSVTRTLKGYVNGVCVYTNTYPSTQTMLPNPSTRALTIGGGSTYSNFDGQLDRVKVYGYVLPNSEIAGEYDGDGDGLPKLWEEANSLYPTNGADASLDSDEDGFANNEEYLSGTNPQDTNSTPGYVRADYEFNEAAWTGGVNEVVDDSGQLNHGRAVNGALITNAAFGSVADFDGINDYVTVSNSASLQMLGSMSVSFWIRSDKANAGYFQMVMEKSRVGEWAISTVLGGLYWSQGSAPWMGFVMPYYTFQTGKWYHVAVTRDAVTRTLKGYLNGICKITNSYPSTQTQLPYLTTRALTIGGGSTYSNFDGQLERVKMYGWILDPAEIVRESSAGADLLNDPSFGVTISGTVSYAGTETGLIQIVAGINSNLWTDSVRRVTIPAPGTYVLTNVVKNWNYWVGAYRDANTNLVRDLCEPFGAYTGNSFYVSTNKGGVNVTMVDADADQDGMPDWWERLYGLDPLDDTDANEDLDGDGLTNGEEYAAGTHANNADTDGDGLPDGWEVEHGLNALSNAGEDGFQGDPDHDGWINGQEYEDWTDPQDRLDANRFGPGIMISEYVYRPAAGQNQWIELFNANEYRLPIDLGGYRIQRTQDGDFSTVLTIPSSTFIQPGDTLLIAGSGSGVTGDLSGAIDLELPFDGTDSHTAGLRLIKPEGTPVGAPLVVDASLYDRPNQYACGDQGFDSYTNGTFAPFTVAGNSLTRAWPGRDYNIGGSEWRWTNNPTPRAAGTGTDPDGDGLTTLQEWTGSHNPFGGWPTDPFNPDSDGDGLADGAEVTGTPATDPLGPDTDSDDFPWDTGQTTWDHQESALGTSPINPDTDGDGLYDGWEIALGLNPLLADSDNDGTSDGQEDSDGDGASNQAEQSSNSNPMNTTQTSGGSYRYWHKPPKTGWANGDDVGYGGVLTVYFEGLKTGQVVCVVLKEGGGVVEHISVKWQGAASPTCWSGARTGITAAVVAPGRNSMRLVITDLSPAPNLSESNQGADVYYEPIEHPDLDGPGLFDQRPDMVEEDQEMTNGHFVVLNDDDDSPGQGNENWDYEDTLGAKTNDARIRPFSLASPDGKWSTVKLTWQPQSKVAVYQDYGAGRSSVASGDTFDVTNLPALFMEGLEASAAMRDTVLTASYDCEVCADQIAVTVVSADVDGDSNGDGSINDLDDELEGSTNHPVFMKVNDNDSNGDGTNDHLNLVIDGASDLAEMTEVRVERIKPYDLPVGTVKLSGASNLRLFMASGTLVKPAAGDAAQAIDLWTNLPCTLWAEGVSLGRDELTLTYSYQRSDGGTTEFSDVIQVCLLKVDMIPDYNHDRKIDDVDRTRLSSNETYRFWLNDDHEISDADGEDWPGSSTPDYNGDHANGLRDLADFFPVYLDIGQAVQLCPTNAFRYVIKQADSALNGVPTTLKADSANEDYKPEAYQTRPTVAQAMTNAQLKQITATGVEVTGVGMENAATTGEGFVMIFEGRNATTSPLVLEIRRRTDDQLITKAEMPLRLSSVTDMYRYLNLRPAAGDTTHGGASQTNEPPNNPDSLSNGKNLVFLHGYSPDFGETTAIEGWLPEVFKRFYWSGSRAKFHAVSWRSGQDDQMDYQKNVTNAFCTASALKDYVAGLSGDVIVAAHSLGNIVVSSAIVDHSMSVFKYMLCDAAVASEAYDATMTQEINLVNAWWTDYSNRTWAVNWYQLFSGTGDTRQNLTWRDRLADVVNNTEAWNFYSTGDEVFELTSDQGLLTGLWSGGIDWWFIVPIPANPGRYSWQKQELFKGTRYSDGWSSFGGTAEAGWGVAYTSIQTEDEDGNYEYHVVPIYTNAAGANAASDDSLRSSPVFKHSPDWLVSTNALSQGQLNFMLGMGIPALTPSIGRTQLPLDIIPLDRQKDLNSPVNTGFKPNGWPADGHTGPFDARWLHNDMKDVAYFYTYKLFDNIADVGGLK